MPYQFDVTSLINTGDIFTSVSAAIAPSGTGELQPLSIVANGFVLTVTESGGQPGRVYTIEFNIITTGADIYQFTVNQGIPPVLPSDVAQVAPIPGFGTPVYDNNPAPDKAILGRDGDYLIGVDGAYLTYA